MSYSRRAVHRKDRNHDSIVATLRSAGATVIVSDLAKLPDLIVGYRRRTYLLEVKTEYGKLSKDQQEFFEAWAGHAVVVRSSLEALREIGAA